MAVKTELLEEIGLTKSEIKVYLALLELGSASSGPIVDKSGASSSKIYEILEKLIQKGLVSYIVKSGVKYFEATDPRRILDYLADKKSQLEQTTSEIKNLLPELELRQKLSQYRSEATIFKGFRGIQSAYEDILHSLKRGQEYYVMGASTPIEPYFSWIGHFHRRRSKLGIKVKILYTKAMEPLAKSIEHLPLTTIKFAPQELLSSAFVLLYANKTLISVSTTQEMTLFKIENQEVTTSLREYFDFLWNQDITVEKGMDSVIGALKKFVDDIQPGDTFDALGAAFGVKGSENTFARAFGEYHRYRLQKKVKARWLFQQGFGEVIEKHKQNYELGEIKLLPYRAESPVSIHPYKNKTLLIVQQKEPSVITINNREVTESFHRQFEALWNQNVTIGNDFEAFEHEWRALFDELKPGESYDVLGAGYGSLDVEEKFARYFSQLHHERIARGITARLLFQPGAEKSIEKYGLQELYHTKLQYKNTPVQYKFPVQIFAAKDRSILLVQKKDPVTIVIKNKEIALSFQQYFNHLWDQDVRILKGLDAVKSVFEDLLHYGSVDFIGARGYFVGLSPKEYIDNWENRATRMGFKMRNIVDPEVRGHRITTFPFAQTKYTLSQEFSKLSVFWIYGDKVVITNWVEKEPIAIVIENKNLHDAYQQQFELLWNQKMVSFEGETGVRAVFDDMLNYKDIYFIGGNGGIKKFFPKYWDGHNRERVKRKISWHDLIDTTRFSDLFPEKLDRVPYYEYKILPPELSSPHVIAFYGDKVANIIWREKTMVTIIEDRQVREGYQKYFEYLWKTIGKY